MIADCLAWSMDPKVFLKFKYSIRILLRNFESLKLRLLFVVGGR